MSRYIRPGETILFQGDSITDAGRCGSADNLGGGYVAMIRGILQATQAKMKLKVINMGVGGDRTVELLARWQRDCLAIRPDVLSIKIGVNDVWRLRGQWNGQTYVTIEQYRANYVQLLEQARSAGIRQLILMSPTTIAEDNDVEFARLLDERTAVVKALARKYKALYVPTRETQKAALRSARDVRWTGDGCHPTIAGHALLAATWLQAVGL